MPGTWTHSSMLLIATQYCNNRWKELLWCHPIIPINTFKVQGLDKAEKNTCLSQCILITLDGYRNLNFGRRTCTQCEKHWNMRYDVLLYGTSSDISRKLTTYKHPKLIWITKLSCSRSPGVLDLSRLFICVIDSYTPLHPQQFATSPQASLAVHSVASRKLLVFRKAPNIWQREAYSAWRGLRCIFSFLLFYYC